MYCEDLFSVTVISPVSKRKKKLLFSLIQAVVDKIELGNLPVAGVLRSQKIYLLQRAVEA